MAIAYRAGQLAAQGAPHAFNGFGGKALGLGQGHGPIFIAAAGGVGAGKLHLLGLAPIGLQLRTPVATGAARRGQRHGAGQRHPGQGQLVMDAGHPRPRVGEKAQHLAVVVDQERIGAHVVRAKGFAIKSARIVRCQGKRCAIEHDVADDDAHPQARQAPQQQPQPLRHQLGVARPPDVHRAAKRAVVDHPIQVQGGAPHKRRPQLVQGRIGGHQLHHRGRIARRGALPVQARGLARRGRGDKHRERIGRNLCAFKRRLHRAGQGRERILGLHRGHPHRQRQSGAGDNFFQHGRKCRTGQVPDR